MDKVNTEIKKRVINQDSIFDKMFVERCGAGIALRDAMSKIIENRPDDPISFLADYFHNLSTREDGIKRAVQEIRLTEFGKQAFSTNLVNAYEILAEDSSSNAVVGKQVCILIDLLLENIDAPVRKIIRKKIVCRECEAIPFDVFRYIVITCIRAPPFIEEGRRLFSTLDFHKQGSVEATTCDALLCKLSKCVAVTSCDNERTPETMLKTTFELSPNKIAGCLAEAGDKSSVNPNVTVNDFLLSLADIYVLSIKSLR